MPSSHWGGWEHEVHIGQEATYGTASSSMLLLPLTAEAQFRPGVRGSEDGGVFSSGSQERQEPEFYDGNNAPTIALEMLYDDYRAMLFLRSFFNALPTPTTGTYAFVAATAADPAANSGLTLVKSAKAGQANAALRGLGCMCTKIVFSSEANGPLKMAVELMPLSITQIAGPSTPGTTVTTNKMQQHNNLVHKLATVQLSPGPSKVEVQLMQEQVGEFYGTNQNRDGIALGRLAVKGNVSYAFRGTNQAAAQIALVGALQEQTYEWGSSAAAGYLKLDFDAAWDDYDAPKIENGIAVGSFPFTARKAASSGHALTVTCKTGATIS